MLNYNANLKDKARHLRKNSTDREKALGSRLRNKQLLGIQFYRQKPTGEHIVDFLTRCINCRAKYKILKPCLFPKELGTYS